MINIVLVTVYCDDASHPKKQAKVGMFKRYDRGRDGWDLIAAPGFQPMQYSDQVNEARALLDGGELAADQLVRPWRMPESGRVRFKLECPLCGLTLTAKDTSLDPILDTLEPHAKPAKRNYNTTRAPRVIRVPLGWLAARITST